MPSYKESVKREKIKEIKNGVLDHIESNGVATLETLTEHFGLRNKNQWRRGLRKKALEELLEENKIVKVVHSIKRTGANQVRRFYVLNDPELIRAAEIAKLRYGGSYHPEAKTLLEIKKRLEEGSPLIFFFHKTTTDPTNKVARNFPNVVELKSRYKNGRYVSELEIKDEKKFKKVIKTLEKTLELRNLYKPSEEHS